MGWTGQYTSESAETVVREELTSGGCRVIANRGARYWVMETPDGGTRFAVVAIVRRNGGELLTKIMTEDMGPYEAKFPVAFLSLLTETDSEYAIAWRQRVRDYHAKRTATPKVAKGAVIRFASPLSFTNGQEVDTFQFIGGYRAVALGSYRFTVRLPKSWRTNYEWEIVDDHR
jgi:hypothetical protein